MNPYRALLRRLAYLGRRSLASLWLVALAGYLAVLGGQAVYKNYQTQQQTTDLRNQLQTALNQKIRLQALLLYYNTDSFKEKELRRSLLLKRPNEKVYALPESIHVRDLDTEPVANEEVAPASPANIPIWRQWYNYLSHRA